MATDASRDRYSGILVPDPRIELWEEESSYSQAGPRPGVPVPSQVTHLTLLTGGIDSGEDETKLVQTQRGGHPDGDDGASYVWKRESNSDEEWYGWEPPHGLSNWTAILWTDGSGNLKSVQDAHSVTLPSGVVLCAVQIRDTTYTGTTGEYRVEVLVRDPDAEDFSRSATPVYGTDTAPAQPFLPCLLLLASGRVVLYHTLVDTTSNLANVRSWYTDDEGSTWAWGGDGVLNEDVDVGSGATDYDLTKMRVAGTPGQVSLFLQVTVNDVAEPIRERNLQFGSDDQGCTFSLVETWTAAANAGLTEVVALAEGGFLVAYVEGTSGDIHTRRLADAFRPISTTSSVTVDLTGPFETTAANAFSDGVLALCVDAGGVVWVYTCSTDGGGSGQSVHTSSSDGGLTWDRGETGPKWSDVGDVATSPRDFCATPYHEQILILGGWKANPGNEDASLACWVLGGFSQVVLPTYGRNQKWRNRITFQDTWYAIELPGDCGWTAAGAGTETLSSPGKMDISCTGGQTRTFSKVPVGSVVNGASFKIRVDAVSGGNLTSNRHGIRIRLDDGASGYDVEIRISGSAWRLMDVTAATQIGSDATYAGGALEIWLALGVGTVDTWYREPATFGGERAWTVGPTGTVTNNAGAGGANLIEFGVRATGVSAGSADWYEVLQVFGLPTSGLIGGQANPTELVGRPYSTRPTYLADGISIVAQGGPTRVGDTWTIATRYDHAISRAVSDTSPRKTWRSAAVEDQEIAFKIRGDLTADCRFESALLGIALLNQNVPSILIKGYDADTSTWVTIGTVNTYDGMGSGLKWLRVGNTVTPGTTAGSQTPYLHHQEHRGATFVLANALSGSVHARRIASHSEGAWRGTDATRIRPVLVLDGVTGSEATSGSNGVLIPRDVVILIDLGTTAYSAIKLTLLEPTASGDPEPAEDYFEVGRFLVGPVRVFGRDYDWGRTIANEAGTELAEARDRTRRSRVAAPVRRILEQAWTGGYDQTDVEADDADPAFISAATGGGAVPVASVEGAPYTVVGVLREIDGADVPVLTIARFTRSTSIRVLNRRGELLYGRLESPVRQETVQGEEGRDEVVRIPPIRFVEEL